MAALRRRDAFRVRFAGTRPSGAALYWRGPVLSRFDGLEWTLLPRMRRGELVPRLLRKVRRD